MEEIKKMIGNLNKTIKGELQKVLSTSMGIGEVKKNYSAAVKGNQKESVMVIKPKEGEEKKSSEETKSEKLTS